jgi:hypothetical protein
MSKNKNAVALGRLGGQAKSDTKTEAARKNAKKGGRPRKTGYYVWLFGDRYWHRTLEGAGQRLREAQNWCNGEHAQCIEAATGENVTETAWEAKD